MTANSDLYRTVSFGEQGPRLPVGILVGDIYHRDIAVRPFRLREEKSIGEYRTKTKALTAGKLVSHLLATLCTRLGPHDFESMNVSDRMLAVSSMELGDVLYAYIYTRKEALGTQFAMGLTCPNCRHNFVQDFNIDDIDVITLNADTAVDRTKHYELRDGLVTANKTYRKFTLGPLLWWSMDMPEIAGVNGLNPALRDLILLRAAITGADGETMRFSDGDLEELSLYDKSGLVGLLSDNLPGPQLIASMICEKCGTEFYQQIDWSYDDFFNRSSRSLIGKQ